MNFSLATTDAQRENLEVLKRKGSKAWQSVGPVVVFIAMFAVVSILTPTFIGGGGVTIIASSAAPVLLVALGQSLVLNIGSIDLSVEGVMSAAGMAFVLLSANTRGGVDYGIWAYVIAIGIGAVLGFANGVLFTKVKVPSFIVTLGMWYVGLGIATIMYGTETMPFLTDDKLSTWASQLTFGLPNNFLLGALVAVLGAIVLRFTSFGRVTLAVGNNEEIAKGNGLKVTRNKITVFILAGAVSGIAGIVATIQLGAVNPTVAAGNLFITIPAVVIGGTSLAGGKGGMFGTMLGVILLTTLNNGLILSGVSPNFQSAVSGAILVLAIVFCGFRRTRVARLACLRNQVQVALRCMVKPLAVELVGKQQFFTAQGSHRH